LERKLLDVIEEDLGFYDITTAFTPDKKVEAEVVVKESCVIAGVYELSVLFDLFDVEIKDKKNDGNVVKENDIIFRLEGSSHDILCVERVALNILGVMSGIATLTKEIVDKAREVNPGIRVAATRKTTPLFRYFEKKAVMVGGGDPHRMRLDDWVLIKDNHLKLFGNVKEALNSARKSFGHKIEIEVDNIEDALEAAESGADIVMLDNMEIGRIKETISVLNDRGLRERVIVEVSGGITLDNIHEYASTGVDVVSVGELTHSSKVVDFSLMVK